jgi:hypothetical protein
MGVHSYGELRHHIGHRIVCVYYGKSGQDPDNIAVECETCNEVLMDFDNPIKNKKKGKSEHPLYRSNCDIIG